jgi:hypothetical protein
MFEMTTIDKLTARGNFTVSTLFQVYEQYLSSDDGCIPVIWFSGSFISYYNFIVGLHLSPLF